MQPIAHFATGPLGSGRLEIQQLSACSSFPHPKHSFPAYEIPALESLVTFNTHDEYLPRSEIIIAIGASQTDTSLNVVGDLTMCVRFHFVAEVVPFTNTTSERRRLISCIRKTFILVVTAIACFVAIAPHWRRQRHLIGLHVKFGCDVRIVQIHQMLVGDFAIARETIERGCACFLWRNGRRAPARRIDLQWIEQFGAGGAELLLIQSFRAGIVIVERVIVVVHVCGTLVGSAGLFWRSAAGR